MQEALARAVTLAPGANKVDLKGVWAEPQHYTGDSLRQLKDLPRLTELSVQLPVMWFRQVPRDEDFLFSRGLVPVIQTHGQHLHSVFLGRFLSILG
jgi:hypothetical protein